MAQETAHTRPTPNWVALNAGWVRFVGSLSGRLEWTDAAKSDLLPISPVLA
jgi:hypothetical protein